MNSALTHEAKMPLTRRTRAKEGFWVSTIAALLVVAPAGAFAADVVAVRTPPPPLYPAPAPFYYFYNWTGFYIGGNLGGAWETSTLTDDFFGVSFSDSRSGFIAGGQIGYNWQLSPNFVIGVEWMFDGTDIRSTDTVFFPAILAATSKVDWITSIAARFGWAVNNWLFYGKAGAGWVHDTFTLTDLTNGLSISESDSKGGWLVGAGIEYGFTPNWTIRVEFDHLGLDSVTTPGFVTRTFPFDVVTLSRHFDMVTVGLNYRF